MNTIALLTFLALTICVALLSWIKTRKEQLHTLSGLFFANRELGFVAVGGAACCLPISIQLCLLVRTSLRISIT